MKPHRVEGTCDFLMAGFELLAIGVHLVISWGLLHRCGSAS